MDYLGLVRSHLGRLVESGRADFGPDPTAMWMSSIDIRTGRYPADRSRSRAAGKRAYRSIDAPGGSSLYWDQPQLAAAHELSRITGETKYAEAADAYVRDFLARCVSRTGLLLWGNHYYWDAFEGHVKKFAGDEEPFAVEPSGDDGDYHEIRPIPPAWDALWRVDPVRTERALRALGEFHVFDERTGGFNRHADRSPGYSFLEAGGILAESLAWLAARTGDEACAELAERVCRFSWEARDPNTGLVPNERTRDRWDRRSCTTEVGLWAGSLLRAAALTGRDAFRAMAREAVRAYLSYGYDEGAGRYAGKLDVKTGRPVPGRPDTPYQPGTFADPWEPLFPTHDYPMAMAAACVALAAEPSGPSLGPDRAEPGAASEFRQAVERWAGLLSQGPRERRGRRTYAESYGRAVHFLSCAGRLLSCPRLTEQARALADEAVAALFDCGMFRGHTGEDRYDAVDGVGFLLVALIETAIGDLHERAARLF